MIEEKSSKRIIKATLEAVFQSQERLRKHLDVLIKENRPLRDDAERDLFFRELAYSTLGLGREQIIDLKIKTEDQLFTGIRSDLETTCRWLAYQNTNIIAVPMDLRELIQGYTKKTANIPIHQLWNTIRNNLFTVFPMTLDRATSLSKEQEEGAKSKGYQIDND